MRNLSKGAAPAVLEENAAKWLEEFLADPTSDTRRHRYRHPTIKEALKSETAAKCVYRESKIGHNTPGDIEHKVPTSKVPEKHFAWPNLTIACTECNRRKSDYYLTGDAFLDPYEDDVETVLVHLGPLVYWLPGHARAEVAVRTLEVDSTQRPNLIDRKRDVLEKARALLSAVSSASNDPLRVLREDELRRMGRVDAEYSAMVLTYLKQVGYVAGGGAAP